MTVSHPPEDHAIKLVAGARLASAVCAARAIVIHPTSAQGVLSCGGVPMEELGKATSTATQLAVPEPGQALTGKRYVDEASGLEVLCTKAGRGAFAFAGRPLTLKQPKPLPNSD
jgi:hypothetical protein